MKYFIVGLVAITLASPIASAQKLMGVVVEKDKQGKDQPLAGANVYWLGTTQGTTTRDNGLFLLERIPTTNQLVISFVGYTSDTIDVKDQNNIKVELNTITYLKEVTVQGWRPSTFASATSGINL